MKQVYFIYSSDGKWVTQQREELLSELMPAELRDENLLEIYSTSSKSTVELGDILPEVLSELGTIPFLPDSRRVVVIHNVAEAFRSDKARKPAAPRKGSKKKAEAAPASKATPMEILTSFATRDLPATPNALIFSSIVEFDRGQEVDDKGAFCQMIQQLPNGRIIRPDYRESNPLFQMSDALLQRNTAACIKHFRAMYRDDMRGRLFHEILRNVRLLVQAKVLAKLEKDGTSRDLLEMKFLPSDKRLNFYMQAEFVQKKIKERMGDFTMLELTRAMERLLELNRILYPGKNTSYVPDVRLLMETFIVEFCEGAVAR